MEALDSTTNELGAAQIRTLNRVLDYITDHLPEDLNNTLLAEIACYSQFHFIRLFEKYLGETPAQTIRRLRLERAATLFYRHIDMTTSDVAIAMGFSSASVFARAFQKYFSMTATQWKKGDFWVRCGVFACWRGCHCEPGCPYKQYYFKFPNQKEPFTPFIKQRREDIDQQVEVVTLPDIKVAYIRQLGYPDPSEPAKLWKELEDWARSKGITWDIYVAQVLDSPHITPAHLVRYDGGVLIEQLDESLVKGINIKTIPGGIYAKFPFKGNFVDEFAIYEYLWFKWLPASDYLPHPIREGVIIGETRQYDSVNSIEDHQNRVYQHDYYIPLLPKQNKAALELESSSCEG